ncbi:M15 family metallopeptidase [Gracilibacillus caseinilyticus]|uniref:M15 family metallopeptidase n=1 Tax=Gracilibacillus caseinilyticus TaxID=2932256 RepID=A0ABY4ESB7_9BACI|nr:M15 family metallopeptidase [Gracilibacillus caseinilyticus]UOQ46782.1 M15 family metallopeptidase [Gracilibacillus caseinilyticus]
MRKYIILLLLITLVTVVSGCQQKQYSAENTDKSNINTEHKSEPVSLMGEEEEPDQENETSSEEDTEADKKEALEVVENPASVSIVVNKQRKLPDGYEPPDLVEADVSYYAPEGDPKRLIRQEAAGALESLFAAAKQEGLELVAVSGYRSYQRQKVIYENNVAANGQEHADKFSAKPGTSEHQTGLAMDVASAALVSVLEQSFIETDEGQWLEDHAHEHGFIIRYPEGKEDITGYSYEPWHLRYVGKDIASEIYEAQSTLEEYFGLLP